jgi:hypothetical protein
MAAAPDEDIAEVHGDGGLAQAELALGGGRQRDVFETQDVGAAGLVEADCEGHRGASLRLEIALV